MVTFHIRLSLLCNVLFRMICCTCEQVDGWKIARNSGAKIFLDEEVITHMTLSYEINSLVICCKLGAIWLLDSIRKVYLI